MLFVFQEMSSTSHAGRVAVTISLGVMPVTINSKLVPLFGAISIGPEVTDPVVPESDISPAIKVPMLIGSSNITLKVAESVLVGST